jgi:hypothetical protein
MMETAQMSEALAAYRRLENELARVRRIHSDVESAEEDDILDQMDVIWSQLSPDEKTSL